MCSYSLWCVCVAAGPAHGHSNAIKPGFARPSVQGTKHKMCVYKGMLNMSGSASAPQGYFFCNKALLLASSRQRCIAQSTEMYM